MKVFARRTVVLLWSFHLGGLFGASAQLASTQIDGLQISVADIYCSGDSRDLDCSLGLKFTGEKADRAISMSKVKIIQAVDDTGMDLVRTNKNSFAGDGWSPTRTWLGFWQSVGGLKAPAANARTIRHLEAEAGFFAPNTNTPVLTNFMSKPGEILHQPTLDKYEIQISYEHEPNDPAPPGSLIIDDSAAGKLKGKTVRLKVDDPQRKLVSLAFQAADGKILTAASTSQSIFGSHTEFYYGFSEVPPTNLNLVVFVDAPEISDRVRFSLENIRLPWIDPPDLQVTYEPVTIYPSYSSNGPTCNLILNFTGGPLTNALGIRKLWINQGTDDAGQNVKVRYDNWRFDALPPVMGDGRNVAKLVPLVFQSTHPKNIRLLEGKVELIGLSATKAGIVSIKDFMHHAGESFDAPRLKMNHVKLAYAGLVNFATMDIEYKKTNSVIESGAMIPKEYPSDWKNSLEFILDDPDHVVIAPFGDNEITILDNQGRSLKPSQVMTAIENHHHVYRFNTLPPLGAQLVIYLAIPESRQTIPFKIENIPLNQTSRF